MTRHVILEYPDRQVRLDLTPIAGPGPLESDVDFVVEAVNLASRVYTRRDEIVASTLAKAERRAIEEEARRLAFGSAT